MRKQVPLVLDEDSHQRLKQLAEANERTMQAQARVILLDALHSEATKPVPRRRRKPAAAGK